MRHLPILMITEGVLFKNLISNTPRATPVCGVRLTGVSQVIRVPTIIRRLTRLLSPTGVNLRQLE